jgi:hypothetical protein
VAKLELPRVRIFLFSTKLVEKQRVAEYEKNIVGSGDH